MKIRFFFIFIAAFLLFPIFPSFEPKETGAADQCSFVIKGTGKMAGTAYSTGDTYFVVSGGRPNSSGALKIYSDRRVLDQNTAEIGRKLVTEITLSTDGAGTAEGRVSGLDLSGTGIYSVEYDKFGLFGPCELVVNNLRFFVPFISANGYPTAWIVDPYPVTDKDTTVSLYITGIGTLGGIDSYRCYMVKSFGKTEDGPNEPGFTGSFASQSGSRDTQCGLAEQNDLPTPGPTPSPSPSPSPSPTPSPTPTPTPSPGTPGSGLDDGGGDICDKNPHPPDPDEGPRGAELPPPPLPPGNPPGNIFETHPFYRKCIGDGHWGQLDFIKPVVYPDSPPESGKQEAILEVRGICEDMTGQRADCSESYHPGDEYRFALYGILDPPTRDTEGNSDPCHKEETKSIPDVDTCDVWGPLPLGTGEGADDSQIDTVSYRFTVLEGKDLRGSFVGGGGIETPFGRIGTTPDEIAQAVLNFSLGVAGGVAFLLMIFGAFRLIFAAGNPDSIQAGRQIITSAIIGLLVIIFSVFILRLIGIGVLGLPIGN